MKKNILLLSRDRLEHMLIETADKLSLNGFNVVLRGYTGDRTNYPIIDMPSDLYSINHKLTDEEFKAVLEKAKQIEEELDLNVFESHQAYLLYGKYVRKYGAPFNYIGSTSYRHSIRHYVVVYEVIKKAIEKYNIQYAFAETIDHVETYILEALDRKNKIKLFTFGWSSVGFEHRIRLASTLTKINPKLDIVYNNNLASKENIDKAIKIIKEESESDKQTGYYAKIHKETIFDKYSIVELLKKINIVNIKYLFNRHKAKKYFHKELPKEKFISYFLQHAPEASIVSEITLWNDQQNVLELLAISGKAEYKIVVKEHPKTFGRRPWKFYQELSNFSNIHFIDNSFDVKEVIKKTEAVLTLTSTSGMMSLLLGKKVFILGSPYYRIAKSVKKIEKPSDLWKYLESFQFDKEDTIKFIASVLESSYMFPKGQKNNVFPEKNGGIVIADMIIDNIKYMETYNKINL